MLPIHRPYMHLSRCACPSCQMCQHHKHKAVFLDQTFNSYLLLLYVCHLMTPVTCPYCVATTHTMNVFCALVEWHRQWTTEIPEDKLITATLCPPQVSHRLNLNWIWPGRLEIREYLRSFIYQMLHDGATITREEMAIRSVLMNTVQHWSCWCGMSHKLLLVLEIHRCTTSSSWN